MRRIKQIVNFIALCLFFDWMSGQDRPKEWLDGDIWIWQHPLSIELNHDPKTKGAE